MKKLILLITCLLTLSQTLSAQKSEWTVVSSSIIFKIKNAGIMVDGTFKTMQATIVFDGAGGSGNSISASVDVNSISTGIGLRNTHLKKEPYFDAKKFPEITMRSGVFTKGKDGTFTGYFKVTIKGKTQTLPLPFTFTENGNKGEFKSEFTINRLDFGVGESSMMMSDNVLVNLDVVVSKKQ